MSCEGAATQPSNKRRDGFGSNSVNLRTRICFPLHADKRTRRLAAGSSEKAMTGLSHRKAVGRLFALCAETQAAQGLSPLRLAVRKSRFRRDAAASQSPPAKQAPTGATRHVESPRLPSAKGGFGSFYQRTVGAALRPWRSRPRQKLCKLPPEALARGISRTSNRAGRFWVARTRTLPIFAVRTTVTLRLPATPAPSSRAVMSSVFRAAARR